MAVKVIAIFVCAVLGAAAAGYVLMMRYPAFGGSIPKKKRKAMSGSRQFAGGRFVNSIPTAMNTDVLTMLSTLADFIKGNPNGKPGRPLDEENWSGAASLGDNRPRVTWFGHSAVLIELAGVTLFADPMLGRAPSPFPFIGGKRYGKTPPVAFQALPQLDAILISHDHYDHLDYGSIRALKAITKRFIVPLGVGVRLERWGVGPERITELDWWDEIDFEGLKLACTPARHFSGRSLLDRDATLWCSWVIRGRGAAVYFSGDSGYGPHFREIGLRYGPFDLTLMECGQYDERWSAIHMMPEETVQAHLDVKGGLMIPIHWAAFTLALHDWTDPVERAVKSANERQAAVATPKIGETVTVGESNHPASAWWRQRE